MKKTLYFLYDDISKKVVSCMDAYTDEQAINSTQSQIDKVKEQNKKFKFRLCLYKAILFDEHTMDIDSGFVVDGKPMLMKSWKNV